MRDGILPRMEWLALPDWNTMFSPDISLVESFLRATIMYLLMFFILRVLPRRQAGEMSMTDMLLTVLVAEASSQAMIGESFSLPNGIVLVCTLFFWNYTLQWLAQRVRWISRFVHAKPIELIRDGKPVEANLHREMITDELLQSQIREEGMQDIGEVKEARVEGDGKISFIKKSE